MEEVLIVTRDINGNRTHHYLRWDSVCDYINSARFQDIDEELLLIIVEGTCIYSGLTSFATMNWSDVLGFFA